MRHPCNSGSLERAPLSDRHDRIDDDWNVEGRRPLAGCRTRMAPSVTPQIDDQVAEAVDDECVVAKAGTAVHVAKRSLPMTPCMSGVAPANGPWPATNASSLWIRTSRKFPGGTSGSGSESPRSRSASSMCPMSPNPIGDPMEQLKGTRA